MLFWLLPSPQQFILKHFGCGKKHRGLFQTEKLERHLMVLHHPEISCTVVIATLPLRFIKQNEAALVSVF